MLNENSIEIFVYYIMAPLVFAIGTFGNITAIIILSRRSMMKLGPRDVYLYMFVFDFIFLTFIITNYLQYGYGYDSTIYSKYSCKLYWYIGSLLAPISPWLLIYISVIDFN